jgi:hypothetical protein
VTTDINPNRPLLSLGHLAEFDDHLDLDGEVRRKLGNADRRARMWADSGPKTLDEQVGATVDHV